MTIYTDPTRDYDRHPERVNFEQIVESGNLDRLMNFVEAFIRKGHNPEDPRDEMYAIMGITPDYLDFVKHDLENRPKPTTPPHANHSGFNAASHPQGPTTTHQSGGKGRIQKKVFGFGPEDDM